MTMPSPPEDPRPADPPDDSEAPTLPPDTRSFHEQSDGEAETLPPVKPGSPGAPTLPPRVERELAASIANHSRYKIIEKLGSGGMGAVYKAEHQLMRRTVALKVIRPELVTNAAAVERFYREVEAAARLDHPNIVTAHDAERAGDAHFLVMEYVEGIDLHQEVQECGPLPVAEACDYIRQAALGLQHAMESGLVHRDIKPQNLILTPDGTVKILDFGLALLNTEVVVLEKQGIEPDPADPACHLTQTGSLMGTPDYIAPEQAADPHDADTRSDIYSLGCTLYYLLTGEVPFPGGTAIDKIIAHTERSPEPVRAFRKDVPKGLVELLDRMFAKDPDERPQEPAKVARILKSIAADLVPCPRPILIASWIWITWGTLVLLGDVGAFVYILQSDTSLMLIYLLATIPVALVGTIPFIAGSRTIQAKASDTKGNGVISIGTGSLIAFLGFGKILLLFLSGWLILAGWLALAHQERYLAWARKKRRR